MYEYKSQNLVGMIAGVRGFDCCYCMCEVSSQSLCCQIDGWTLSLHRFREKEEADGWEGVDDPSGAGVCTGSGEKESGSLQNVLKCLSLSWSCPQKCMMHSVCLNSCVVVFFILKKKKNPGGEEKQESKQWMGGRRPRWPTTPRVPRN